MKFFVEVENVLSDLDHYLTIKRGLSSFNDLCKDQRRSSRKEWIKEINKWYILPTLTLSQGPKLGRALIRTLQQKQKQHKILTPSSSPPMIKYVSMFDVGQCKEFLCINKFDEDINNVISLKEALLMMESDDVFYGCNCGRSFQSAWIGRQGIYMDLSVDKSMTQGENFCGNYIQCPNESKDRIDCSNGHKGVSQQLPLSSKVLSPTPDAVSPLKTYDSYINDTKPSSVCPSSREKRDVSLFSLWDNDSTNQLPGTSRVMIILLKHLYELVLRDEKRDSTRKKENQHQYHGHKDIFVPSCSAPYWKLIKQAITDVFTCRANEFLDFSDKFLHKELSNQLRSRSLFGVDVDNKYGCTDFTEYTLMSTNSSSGCRIALCRSKRQVAIQYSSNEMVYYYQNVDDDICESIERNNISREAFSKMIKRRNILFVTSNVFPTMVPEDTSIILSPISYGSQEQVNWSRLITLALYNYFLSCTPTLSVLYEPIENLQKMNNIFESSKHLIAYHECTEWNRSTLQCISTVMSSTMNGSKNNVGIHVLQRLHDELKRRLAMVLSGVYDECPKLRFKGVANSFTEEDYNELSKTFKEAKLYHLLPLYPVARGVVFIMLTMGMINRKMRIKGIYQHNVELTLHLQNFMLQSREDFMASNSLPHAHDVFKFARGICWERKIIEMNYYHGVKPSMLNMKLEQALEDPHIPSHTRLLLQRKQDDLWRKDQKLMNDNSHAQWYMTRTKHRKKYKKTIENDYEALCNNTTPHKYYESTTEKHLIERVFEGSRKYEGHESGDALYKHRILYKTPSCSFTLSASNVKGSAVDNDEDDDDDDNDHDNKDDESSMEIQLVQELSCNENSIEVGGDVTIDDNDDNLEHDYDSSSSTISNSKDLENEIFYVERLAALRYLDKIAGSNVFKCCKDVCVSPESKCRGKVTLTPCKRDTLHIKEEGIVKIIGSVSRNVDDLELNSKLLQLDNEYEYEWVVAHSEARIWRTLLYLFFVEMLGYRCNKDNKKEGGDNGDGVIKARGREQIIPGPLDFLPSHYSHWMNSSVPPPLSSFYETRKTDISKRLDKISELKQSSHLRSEFKRCFEIQSTSHWLKEDYYRLEDLAVSLGGQRMRIIFEYMLSEPESYMRGQPDLLFWKARKLDHDKKTPILSSSSSSSSSSLIGAKRDIDQAYETPPVECELVLNKYENRNDGPWMLHDVFAVEVKSAKDLLSPWQVLWIKLLGKADVCFELCRVNEKRI